MRFSILKKIIFLGFLGLFALLGTGCQQGGGDAETQAEDLEAFLSDNSSSRPQVEQEPFVPPETADPYRVDDHTGGAIHPTPHLPSTEEGSSTGGSESDRPASEDTGSAEDGEKDKTKKKKGGFLSGFKSFFSGKKKNVEPEPEVDEEDVPDISGLEVGDSEGEEEEEPAPAEPVPSSAPAYQIDFTQSFSSPAEDVLDDMGFEVPSIFISDIDARFAAGAMLVGRFSKGYFGLRKKQITEIPEEKRRALKRMKLSWGIAKYPPGEDWNNSKKRRNSVAIIVSFGKKTSAGVPYFLGFSLTQTGEIGRYFRPSRYGDVGRYVTLAQPAAKVFLESDVDLKQHFHAAFGSSVPYPGVSGLAIEVDTRGMSGVGGIKKIQFFE